MSSFAEGTTVPIHRSRSEIDALLRDWGAEGVSWGDDWANGRVFLRFIWIQRGTSQRFQARLIVKLQSQEEIERIARGRRQYAPPPAGKLQKLLDDRGKREHRVLLLWLKAAFNAIELGLITAEELFLPFLEGADGQTVAEIVIPRVDHLLGPGGTRLLPPPGATP